MLTKNERIEVTFTGMTHMGHGVAKVDGYPLFVPGGLVGEVATIQVEKVGKRVGHGKLIEIHEKSKERQVPPCPVYEQCGGCQIQHLTYLGQLETKNRLVHDMMTRIGKLKDVVIHPIVPAADSWYYRNKFHMAVEEGESGLQTGFYKEKSHQLIPLVTCPLQNKEIDTLVQSVRQICDKYQIPAYNKKKQSGVLRHLMVRIGQATGEVMLIFVTQTKVLPNAKQIIQEIITKHPQVTSIVQNMNPKRTSVILGDKTKVLYGDKYIYDQIGNLTFGISALSFYQVNPKQTKILYEQALAYANLTGEETVIDAYCGIGTISLFLGQKAKKVYGVEIIPEAIADAKRNAKLNGMDNVEFVVGKAEEVIPAWHEAGIRADVLCLDPPRKGCDEGLLQTILQMKPKKIVYVSCNPATLARDLQILETGGYKTKEIQPVDQFPQTTHVETVVLMSRVKVNTMF